MDELEREFDPETWQVDPFGLLLAESVAIMRLGAAEATGDPERIEDAKGALEELNA